MTIHRRTTPAALNDKKLLETDIAAAVCRSNWFESIVCSGPFPFGGLPGPCDEPLHHRRQHDHPVGINHVNGDRGQDPTPAGEFR
jgi:hypothetical protein